MNQTLEKLLSLDTKLLEMEIQQGLMDGIKICASADEFSRENQSKQNKD